MKLRYKAQVVLLPPDCSFGGTDGPCVIVPIPMNHQSDPRVRVHGKTKDWEDGAESLKWPLRIGDDIPPYLLAKKSAIRGKDYVKFMSIVFYIL